MLDGVLLEGQAGSIFRTNHLVRDLPVERLRRLLPLHPCFQIESEGINPEEVCFLDTETTGLAGGTGTMAFLIGIGRFEDGCLQVRQYFMQGPADEVTLLDLLDEELSRCRLLVTFNGRTFDWPLIETRYRIHRRNPSGPFNHFDVLHPARRVWRARLGDCSLGNLETCILGGHRRFDVPGFLIPQLYFDYLRDGDARRLLPVFAHNRADIISMTQLALILLAATRTPGTLVNPEDRAGLGLLLLARGNLDTGIAVLEEVLSASDLSADIERRVAQELTVSLKRLGRTRDALPYWRRMCEHAAGSRPLDLFPFEELAKYYEHQARDIEAAIQVVERALRLLELSGSRLGRDALNHRLLRLERKRIASRLGAEASLSSD
ncbi:MAG TPA: ribonuclease H-like domain-containing protein [Thermomicrobiaceae bacterium]|nr:ribonuclease H-like domain-containing protein [Thermomicrobiaceae bacterium]